jgi:uncharacterized membrane protein
VSQPVADDVAPSLVRPATALAAAIAIYVAVFGTLTWAQQSNFGTFGFDMGIHDQAIWLLSRFRWPFDTIVGLPYFAHHVNLIVLLYVPFYWLGAGPHFLYLTETVAMALLAVPIFLLARDRLGDEWLAAALGVCALLYPSLEWINWWHFHPDALSMTPLAFAYWLATRREWRWCALAVTVTLACKEDAALAVFALGLVLLWRRAWRPGIVVGAAGAVWFALCTRVIIPLANHGHAPFYEHLFDGFGSTPTEVAVNIVRHPTRLGRVLEEPSVLTYFRQLLAPVAFVAVFALPVLVVGGPQALVNIITVQGYAHDIKYQYSALVDVAVLLAAVEGIAALSRHGRGVARFAVGLVVATSAAANVAWSPSPLSVKYHSGVWARPSSRLAAVNAAMRHVPSHVGVSATYYFVPHLTHRVDIYEFPNPWVVANWFGPGRPADRHRVRWLVLDTRLNTDQRALITRLTAPGGAFQIVYQRDDIVVAHRVRQTSD